jgi:3-oxoacyl-[acyl-carrier-protein] synthase II
VAVTGMGVVSPAGAGVDAFRKALFSGVSSVSTLTLFDPVDLASKVAGQVSDFDPAPHMAPGDHRRVSRASPMGVAASREALAAAGIEAGSEGYREMGIILGTGAGGIEFGERQYQHYFQGENRQINPYAISTSFVGSLSSDISITLALTGPSHVLSTGCTSSSDAIGYAARNISAGLADLCLTGGVEACITPAIMAGFCRMKVISTGWNDRPENSSRPFDEGRDGFVIGEGAWMFVLEEMERARSRGAKILGEVCGYGSTCDAYHRVALDPAGEQPIRAIELALEDAACSPEAVDYVNLHGTGTRMNDVVESRVIRKALSRRAGPPPVSATKSVFGHPQGASGALGVAATLLAMEQSEIPPTVNLERPDPECEMDHVMGGSRPADLEWAICNCIGFGSKNSSLVLRRI